MHGAAATAGAAWRSTLRRRVVSWWEFEDQQSDLLLPQLVKVVFYRFPGFAAHLAVCYRIKEFNEI